MKIGVFDSGRGGKYMASGLKKLLPEHEYMVVNDREHVPYGSRTDAEIIELTDAAIQPLIQSDCPIIIIACNTATTAAIVTLRERHPATQFIGVEPMIKPAASLSTSQHITVLATPLTLASNRYRHLKELYGNSLTIDEPNTAGWAAHIEFDTANEISYDEIAASVASGSDYIVLACTHYNHIYDDLAQHFPTVGILEPTEAIARQVARLAA